MGQHSTRHPASTVQHYGRPRNAATLMVALRHTYRALPKTSSGVRCYALPPPFATAPQGGMGSFFEPPGCQRGKLLQGLVDERQVWIDPRRPGSWPDPGQTGLGQHPRHPAMVDAQLAGDGAATPFFNVIIAQDLRFEIRGVAIVKSFSIMWTMRRRTRWRRKNPWRTNSEGRRPHQ